MLRRMAPAVLAGLVAWACAEAPGETVVLTITARPPAEMPPALEAGALQPPLAGAARRAGTPRSGVRTTNQPAASPSPPSPAPTPSPTPALTPSPSPTPTPAPVVLLDGRRVRLLEVIDGDTIKVDAADGAATIRLIGFDTPELDDHAGQRAAAATARDELRRLLTPGAAELVADAEPQEPNGGRLLRHAVINGAAVAVTLTRMGLARAFPHPPNLRFAEAIAAAEREARAAGRGLWNVAEGIAITVDKAAEVATVRNTSPASIDLAGWWLVSRRGHQTFRFPSGLSLAPGEALSVAAGDAAAPLSFGARNVWNNSRRDSAELRRPDGRIASVWDDADPP